MLIPASLKAAKGIFTSMTEKRILRGEIWLINFDPTVGAEIQKIRPGLIISSDSIGILPIRLVAPITSWKADFKNNIWHVLICPDKGNGLQKDSAIDIIQIRSMDVKRFIKRLGKVPDSVLSEVGDGLLNVIDYRLE